MGDAYMLAFDFWRLLATEEDTLGDSVALANPEVPLLLSNAAWFPREDDIQCLAPWYSQRGITPALVVPVVRNEALEKALRGSRFSLEHTFAFSALREPEAETGLITEQVSWAQGRALGEHLAAHYGYPAYGVQFGIAITTAMQRCPRVVSYAAYDPHTDDLAGALIALETEHALVAMMTSGELGARLHQEAKRRGLQAHSFELLQRGGALNHGDSLERWSLTG